MAEINNFIHPIVPITEVHLVQSIVFQMRISIEPTSNVAEIGGAANVEKSHTTQTLRDMECVKMVRMSGPKMPFGQAKTVNKIFDAVEEPREEGLIPIKCRNCPFSNSNQRTAIRNRKTSGCVILGYRAIKLNKT